MQKQHDENRESTVMLDESSDSTTLKLAQEEVTFSKQEVIAGRVKVTRKTVSREQQIDETLMREHIKVEHVPKQTPVDEIPDIREEDGVIIIPVVEERIEVIRTLVLTEELHIRKSQESTPFRETTTLRKQEIFVDRHEEDQ